MPERVTANIPVFITHHPNGMPEERQRIIYQRVYRSGINSVRFDIPWEEVVRERGKVNQQRLGHYLQARHLMLEEGLSEPTIILGTGIPNWAQKLSQQRPEEFLHSFAEYVYVVAEGFYKENGKIKQIQMGNELNTKQETKFDVKFVPDLCFFTRLAFDDHNPNIKLSTTIMAGNGVSFGRHFGYSIGIMQFLRAHREMLTENFDVIGIDYYPTLWHIPLREVGFNVFNFKKMARQVEPLKELIKEVAPWRNSFGKRIKYELSETGFPTHWPWGFGQKQQEEIQQDCYIDYMCALGQMFEDFQKCGIHLPSRIGIYSAVDASATKLWQRAARRFLPYPEHDFGLMRQNCQPKLVLHHIPDLIQLFPLGS